MTWFKQALCAILLVFMMLPVTTLGQTSGSVGGTIQNGNSSFSFSIGSGGGAGGGWNPGSLFVSGLPTGASGGGLIGVFRNIMLWILGIFGFIAIIAFVASGILYLTSVGDQGRADTAKQYMIYSIIGVIVGLSGLIIVTAINNWLSGRSVF